MKIVRITSTAILSLVIGIAPAYAQREGEKQGKPEPQHEQAKPPQRHAQPQQHGQQQQTAQPQKQERGQQQHAQPQQRAQHQEQGRQQAQQRHVQVQRTLGQRQSQQREQHGAWRGRRAQNWESEHRNWQQRGGYNGYRVPDNYFSAHFGMGHPFHVFDLPFLIVGGYPRFQYEGYWFSAVDPYPEYWGDDWYRSDDVYVNYVDNGYYLFNRRYPGRPGVAISISL